MVATKADKISSDEVLSFVDEAAQQFLPIFSSSFHLVSGPGRATHSGTADSFRSVGDAVLFRDRLGRSITPAAYKSGYVLLCPRVRRAGSPRAVEGAEGWHSGRR